MRWVVASAGLALAGCSAGTQPNDAKTANDDAIVDVWLKNMEVGSREFYSAREAVVAATGLRAGDYVADVGAGTGLYSLLFAKAVGPEGEVFAVDIEPRFLKLINQRAEDLDLSNVAAVLGRSNAVALPPSSIDVAFICDTYNYFADPAQLMASLRVALKPGGRLYVLDFDLPAGAAPPPELQHVRLGKDGVRTEILSYGFAGGEVIPVAGLKDTYMLKFTKPV